MSAPLIILTPTEMRAWSTEEIRRGHQIVVVPTMGALHRGHEVLIEQGGLHGDKVVVTIFVNPLQFDRAEDFDSYPRPASDDIEICARLGVDAIYFPTAPSMYPAGFDTKVEPGAIAERYEGAHRPGHFTGVATVVTKLFGAVRPDVAMFGQKDAQQLALITRMTADLDLGVRIQPVATVREADGLAMSSRNRRLQPKARQAAVCIPTALRQAVNAQRAGITSWEEIRAEAVALIEAEPLATLEYFDLVDPATFTPLDLEEPGREGLLVLAVWVDGVRLIDNLAVTHTGL
jgi:pantoate--beta-alanine ligase